METTKKTVRKNKPTQAGVKSQMDMLEQIETDVNSIQKEVITDIEDVTSNVPTVNNTNLALQDVENVEFETIPECVQFEIVELKEVNDFLIGFYIGTQTIDKFKVHLFQKNESDIKGLFASHILDENLPKYEGYLLKITFKGYKQTKAGYRVKIYSIGVSKS